MDPHTQKIRKIIINTAENMAIKVNNKIRTTIVGGEYASSLIQGIDYYQAT